MFLIYQHRFQWNWLHRLVMVYNYNDITEAITLSDLEAKVEEGCSFLDARGAPQIETGSLRSGFVLSKMIKAAVLQPCADGIAAFLLQA